MCRCHYRAQWTASAEPACSSARSRRCGAERRRLRRRGSGLKLVLVTNPVRFLPPARAARRRWARAAAATASCSTSCTRHQHADQPLHSGSGWSRRATWATATLGRLVQSDRGARRHVATLSVGWDGRLYDCDFNQMLELEVGCGAPRHLREFERALLDRRRIVTGRHCFGCAAGAGSSCGGAVA